VTAFPNYHFLEKTVDSGNKSIYHASQAILPWGYFLTHHFLSSSANRSQKPKAMGRKKYSTGMGDALIAVFKPGIYKKTKIIAKANRIAGNRSRFWVALLNAGGCWKIERRLVRVAITLNHSVVFQLAGYYIGERFRDLRISTRVTK
jgi:hypothetical protein